MLRPRIIPCLLVRKKGLVKTVRFASPRYVGDPINAVKIFNEKEVDELIVLDIDATVAGTEPDYEMIRNVAAECRMPLCYGGGIRSVEQAVKVIGLGVEKVAVSAAAVAEPSLIAAMAKRVGSQSVVAVLDIRRDPATGRAGVWTHNGTRDTGIDPVESARKLAAHGAGEITINAIDRDGVMGGYDVELVREVRDAVPLPITVLGGAGSLRDIESLIRTFGVIGAAAGSLFVFKGAYKAVLINYPARADRRALCETAMAGAVP